MTSVDKVAVAVTVAPSMAATVAATVAVTVAVTVAATVAVTVAATVADADVAVGAWAGPSDEEGARADTNRTKPLAIL
jgi:hypothetical protein